MYNALVDVKGIASSLPKRLTRFKEIKIRREVKLTKDVEISQISRITAIDTIKNSKLISSPKSISFEGQILTGKKLIVQGEVNLSIEYTTEDCNYPTYTFRFKIPYNTYIVVEEDFSEDKDYIIEGYIQDIYIKMKSNRDLVVSILLCLCVVD